MRGLAPLAHRAGHPMPRGSNTEEPTTATARARPRSASPIRALQAKVPSRIWVEVLVSRPGVAISKAVRRRAWGGFAPALSPAQSPREKQRLPPSEGP